MREKDEKTLRLLAREPEPLPEAEAVPPEIDTAESRWDPWLVALARLELSDEERWN